MFMENSHFDLYRYTQKSILDIYKPEMLARQEIHILHVKIVIYAWLLESNWENISIEGPK